MGFIGSITIFTESPALNPATTFLALCREFGVDRLLSASTTVDHSWSGLQALLRGEDVSDQCDDEYLSRPAPHEAAALLTPERCLYSTLFFPDWVRDIEQEVKQIPESIRGDFAISNVGFRAGPHDLFEAQVEPMFFGRATASVNVEGMGSPRDWAKAREVLTQLPSVRALAARLEPIIGLTKICAYWDG